jgi:hypothetical protein
MAAPPELAKPEMTPEMSMIQEEPEDRLELVLQAYPTFPV